MKTIADTYRETRDVALRIANDRGESAEIRAAMRKVAENNDRLFAGCATHAAHEGKRLPKGTVCVRW